MNLIPYYYRDADDSFTDDWTAQSILGGLETMRTIWWSRKTHVIYFNDWSGWDDPSGWLDVQEIVVGISETHPRVSSKPSEATP